MNLYKEKQNYREGRFGCVSCGVDLHKAPKITITFGARTRSVMYACSMECLKEAVLDKKLDASGERFKKWACRSDRT